MGSTASTAVPHHPHHRDPSAAVDGPGWLPPWEGAAYAANTGHHRVHDAWFFEDLPLRPGDRVLDLGCGSGDFSRLVADRIPDGELVGIDAQPSMIAEARRVAAPNQRFLVAPVQQLHDLIDRGEVPAAHFDVVFSRSVMHWVPAADHPGVLAAAHRLLRPGGWLRIECGGAGNVQTVVRAFAGVAAGFGYSGAHPPWSFLDAGTAFEMAERAGFVLDTDRGDFARMVVQRRAFDRQGFHGWVHSQAIEAYLASLDAEHREAFAAAVDEHLDDFRHHDGSFDQTFVRLDVKVHKPT